MRTTLNIEDALIRAAKQRAVEEGETLTQVLDRALRLYLGSATRRTEPFRFDPMIKSGRAADGVNWDDRDSLYERMEGRS